MPKPSSPLTIGSMIEPIMLTPTLMTYFSSVMSISACFSPSIAVLESSAPVRMFLKAPTTFSENSLVKGSIFARLASMRSRAASVSDR